MSRRGTALTAIAIAGVVWFVCLMLSCALYHKWWPLFNMAPLMLLPIPWVISSFAGANPTADEQSLIWFAMGRCLVGVVIASMFGLPAVMYSHASIVLAAFIWIMVGNIVLLGTVGFFVRWLSDDDDEYLLG